MLIPGQNWGEMGMGSVSEIPSREIVDLYGAPEIYATGCKRTWVDDELACLTFICDRHGEPIAKCHVFMTRKNWQALITGIRTFLMAAEGASETIMS